MSAKFKLTGDSRGAVKAHQDLRDELKKTERQTKETAKESEKYNRQAQRIKESIDPQERYNRKVAETARLVRDGRLTQDEANRALQRYQEQLRRAEQRQSATFSSAFLSRIGAVAAGFFGIGSAVAAATRFFGDLEQQANSAAQASIASLTQIGKLQQLEDAPALAKFSRQLVGEGIAKDAGEAADITFALESASLTPSERLFAARRLAGTRAVPSSELAATSINIKKAQNQLDLGTFEDATNKLLAASGLTETTLTGVAESSTRFGTDLNAAGLSGETGLAAMVAILKSSPNREQAATRLAAFLREANNRGFTRDTMGGTLDAIQAEIATGKSTKDVIGSEEAVRGFRNLVKNRDLFERAQTAIGSAADDDLVAQRFGQLEQEDPNFRAGVLQQRAEGRLAMVNDEKFTELESLFNTVVAARVATMREQGTPERVIALERAMFATRDFFGGERGTLENILTREQQGTDTGVSDDALSAIRDYLRRTAEATEQQAEGQPTRTRAE